MPFRHDSTGVEADVFEILPDGYYPFRIYEAEEMKSKSGYDMVLVKAQVSGHSEQFDGSTVWHYVTFLPKDRKGAGISVHFRKCIGVPFGGNDVVDAEEWKGKRFMGKVVKEEYDGKTRNKLAEISPMPDSKGSDDAIPF